MPRKKPEYTDKEIRAARRVLKRPSRKSRSKNPPPTDAERRAARRIIDYVDRRPPGRPEYDRRLAESALIHVRRATTVLEQARIDFELALDDVSQVPAALVAEAAGIGTATVERRRALVRSQTTEFEIHGQPCTVRHWEPDDCWLVTFGHRHGIAMWATTTDGAVNLRTGDFRRDLDPRHIVLRHPTDPAISDAENVAQAVSEYLADMYP